MKNIYFTPLWLCHVSVLLVFSFVSLYKYILVDKSPVYLLYESGCLSALLYFFLFA